MLLRRDDPAAPHWLRGSLRGLLAAANLLLAPAGAAWAQAAQTSSCEQAGQAAELSNGLPPGLLLALGRVESGRWDPARGRIAAWPWTIDVAGDGRFFPDKQSAIRATEALLEAGQRNIDVGCFQISLLHHPLAFPDLEAAFDPSANAAYAAQFLASLYARRASWTEAVAAYHSADPARGQPYRDLVLAAWHASPASLAVTSSSVPSVHVWTPSPVGAAPQLIELHPLAASSGALPRVITPGG